METLQYEPLSSCFADVQESPASVASCLKACLRLYYAPQLYNSKKGL